MTWTLVQYVTPDGIRGRGALVDGRVVALPEGLPGDDVLGLLAQFSEVESRLRTWSPDRATAVAGARLVAPLTYPAVILGAGANYYSHCAEMGVGVPDPDGEPFFFTKPPTTTIIGPRDDISYPTRPGTKLDWEAELGVVIGRPTRNITESEVRSHVAGYVVANDVSARDRTARPDAVSPHFVYDWLGHKGQDGFCPTGPGVTPAWLVPDPHILRIQLWVNGVLKQDATTEDMVIGVDRLVAAASRVVTLQPGDLILTGTPAGVGAARDEFLHPGDTVTATIEGIGTISNRVAA